MRTALAVLCVAAACLAACSDAEKARLKATTKATYDKTTGKLIELTYDANKDGRIDTWTEMDGTRPVRSRIDLDEDGTLDRWEYYDDKGALLKVGFSRRKNGKPDAWAFARPDGRIDRIDVSSSSDEQKIDRWEHYAGAGAAPNGDASGAIVSAEEDTSHRGRPDRWETYKNGVLETVAFDENGDGRPDRRLTYVDGRLAAIETDPGADGHFRKRVTVPQR